MVGAVHNKLAALRERAKLADDQFVANKLEMILNISLFKILRSVPVIIIGEVTHFDVWGCDVVFQKDNTINIFDRKWSVWIRAVHGLSFAIKSEQIALPHLMRCTVIESLAEPTPKKI
jgi:hypothetical protein